MTITAKNVTVSVCLKELPFDVSICNITDSNDGIMLSSYEIPEGEDKNTFSYVSHFTPVMIFCLWEKFSEECLEVSESMELMERKPSDMMNRSFIKEYNDMKTKCSVQCTEHLK